MFSDMYRRDKPLTLFACVYSSRSFKYKGNKMVMNFLFVILQMCNPIVHNMLHWQNFWYNTLIHISDNFKTYPINIVLQNISSYADTPSRLKCLFFFKIILCNLKCYIKKIIFFFIKKFKTFVYNIFQYSLGYLFLKWNILKTLRYIRL